MDADLEEDTSTADIRDDRGTQIHRTNEGEGKRMFEKFGEMSSGSGYMEELFWRRRGHWRRNNCRR